MNKNPLASGCGPGALPHQNVVFIAINGLVGLSLAPAGWMATLPVMGYVVGGALSTGLVGTQPATLGPPGVVPDSGLAVAAALGTAVRTGAVVGSFLAAGHRHGGGRVLQRQWPVVPLCRRRTGRPGLPRESGLTGAGRLVCWGRSSGPNLAEYTRDGLGTPFLGAYLALAGVALLSMLVMAGIQFPPEVRQTKGADTGRPLALTSCVNPYSSWRPWAPPWAMAWMNLLMAATPLAMQVCGMPFDDAAFVLEWHVIGMFARALSPAT